MFEINFKKRSTTVEAKVYVVLIQSETGILRQWMGIAFSLDEAISHTLQDAKKNEKNCREWRFVLHCSMSIDAIARGLTEMELVSSKEDAQVNTTISTEEKNLIMKKIISDGDEELLNQYQNLFGENEIKYIKTKIKGKKKPH